MTTPEFKARLAYAGTKIFVHPLIGVYYLLFGTTPAWLLRLQTMAMKNHTEYWYSQYIVENQVNEQVPTS